MMKKWWKNDEKMMKPTSFFKKRGAKRLKIFPISKKNNITLIANKLILKKINEYSFKKLNTVLSLEGFISGSNSSGSNMKPLNSPIIFFDEFKNNEFNGLRFINASKNIRKTKNFAFKKISNFNELEKSFKYIKNINTLINESKEFRNSFFYINGLKNDSDLEYINFWSQNINKRIINDDIFRDISLFKNNMIIKKKLISRLRAKFKINLIKEAKAKKISEYVQQGLSIDFF